MVFFSPINAYLQLNALKHAGFRKLDCTKLHHLKQRLRFHTFGAVFIVFKVQKWEWAPKGL